MTVPYSYAPSPDQQQLIPYEGRNNGYSSSVQTEDLLNQPYYPMAAATMLPSNYREEYVVAYTNPSYTNNFPDSSLPKAEALPPTSTVPTSTPPPPVFSQALDQARSVENSGSHPIHDDIMSSQGSNQNNTNLTNVPCSNIIIDENLSPEDMAQEARFRRMKERRVTAQVAAGTAGAVGGLIVLGPIGAIVGGVVANKVTKAVAKKRETRIKDQYYAQRLGDRGCGGELL